MCVHLQHQKRKNLADFLQLNYLTKYLELLDTVFMVLKKKPLSTRFLPSHWRPN